MTKIEHSTILARDSQGRRRQINVFTEFQVEHHTEGTERVLSGMRFALNDGQELTRIEKGKYRLDEGELFTSDAPNAP